MSNDESDARIIASCDEIEKEVEKLRGLVPDKLVDAMGTVTAEFRAALAPPKCATDECVSLFRDIQRRTDECATLAKDQLMPAASTSKRLAATERLLAALVQIGLGNQELMLALADVEDAV